MLVVNRFFCCRGLEIIGLGDKVEVFRRGVVNGFIFSCIRMV